MSNKMTCPACDSYTSSVRMAFESGNDCPNCGLSADAAIQIEQAAKRGADADLLKRTADLERSNARMRSEVRELRLRLGAVSWALVENIDSDMFDWGGEWRRDTPTEDA